MVMILVMMMMMMMVVAAMKRQSGCWLRWTREAAGVCHSRWTLDSALLCSQCTVHTNHSAHKTQCTQNTVHTVHTAQSLMMDTALHCTSVPVTGDQTAPGDLLQGGNVSQQPGPVSISLVLLPQPLINVKKNTLSLLRLN